MQTFWKALHHVRTNRRIVQAVRLLIHGNLLFGTQQQVLLRTLKSTSIARVRDFAVV
jgi:hypothetical protein